MIGIRRAARYDALAGPVVPAVRETYRLRQEKDGCRLEFRLILGGMPVMAGHLVRARRKGSCPWRS